MQQRRKKQQVARKLVIVESPAKARTIGGLARASSSSSIEYIRDLPQSAADTPAKIKDKP